MSRVVVIGEAIADFLPLDGEPRRFDCALGGSGFNTALGLARLGLEPAFAWSVSSDALGARFRQALDAEGVDLSLAVERAAPTALAVVSPGAASHGAMFALHLVGTAHENPPDLTALPMDTAAHLHVASFAGTVGAGAEPSLSLLRRFRTRRTSSYDPNIRAACLPPPAEAAVLVEERVAAATIAKASEEDLGWLYPGLAPHDALQRWRLLGAKIAICTRGPRGALALGDGGLVEVAAPAIRLVDTVGAGDVFTAGFLAAMAEDGALGDPACTPGDDMLARWLGYAIRAAARTCERAGCDPPRRGEL